MNREEQIAEIAKIIDEMYWVYDTTAGDIAEALYNAGYRREATLTCDFIKMAQKYAIQKFVDELRNKCSEVKEYEYSFANIAHLINQLLEEYKDD